MKGPSEAPNDMCIWTIMHRCGGEERMNGVSYNCFSFQNSIRKAVRNLLLQSCFVNSVLTENHPTKCI